MIKGNYFSKHKKSVPETGTLFYLI